MISRVTSSSKVELQKEKDKAYEEILVIRMLERKLSNLANLAKEVNRITSQPAHKPDGYKLTLARIGLDKREEEIRNIQQALLDFSNDDKLETLQTAWSWERNRP